MHAIVLFAICKHIIRHNIILYFIDLNMHIESILVANVFDKFENGGGGPWEACYIEIW